MELELPRLLAPDLPSNCYSKTILPSTHSNCPDQGCPQPKALVFLVTTSPFRHRVIYAPAAFLGSGSRFSGSLSGIEPLFPVTRHKNGRPLSYQPLDRSVIQLVCRHGLRRFNCDPLLAVLGVNCSTPKTTLCPFSLLCNTGFKDEPKSPRHHAPNTPFCYSQLM